MKIIIQNNKCQLIGKTKLILKLRNHPMMAIKVKGAFFSPAFRRRQWDGFIRFVSERGYVETGKLPQVIDILNEWKEPVELFDERERLKEGVIPEKIGPYEVRDHQREAVISVVANVIRKRPNAFLAIPFPRGIIAAATNAGKCIGENDLILTSGGIIKANELFRLCEGVTTLRVINHMGKITGIGGSIDSGNIPSLTITTSNGYDITVGRDNHRLFCGSWKFAKELRVGDDLQLGYNNNLYGDNTYIGKYKLSENLAYMLGALHGDGNIKERGFSISSHIKDTFILDVVGRALSELGVAYKIQGHPKFNGKRILKRHRILKEILNEVPELVRKSHTKEIPLLIRRSNKLIIKSYLRGLFDTDGSADRRTISLTSVSYNTIKQVQDILLNMGIVSRRDIKKTSWVYLGVHKKSIAYRICIKDYYRNIFNGEVGFGLKRKIIKYPKRSNKTADILPANLLNNIIELRNKYGINCKIPISRYIRRKTKFSKGIVSDFVKLCRNKKLESYLIEPLDQWVNGNYIYDTIKSIKPGKTKCYDFYIPNGNSYLANGFINHNTLISAAIHLTYKSKTILLLNSKELFDDMKREMPKMLPGKVGFISSEHGIKWNDFMIVMVQTAKSRIAMVGQRLASYPVVLVDEGDLATSKSYKEVLGYTFNSYVRVALSGSAMVDQRQKEKNERLRAIFGDIIYQIKNRELMDKGFSSEVYVNILQGNTKIKLKGDYPTEYRKGIIESKERNRRIIRRLNWHFKKGRESILIMVKNHAHIKVLYQMIVNQIDDQDENGYSIDWVHHKREDRHSIVDKFTRGKLNVLVGSFILKRGKNFPLMEVIINASGGDSMSNVLQILGRATRTHESKEYTILDDFFDEGAYLKRHSKHRLITYTEEKLQIKKYYS